MKSFISDRIMKLQSGGILPSGNYEYVDWEQQFSFIFRVTINGEVFYFKKLKPRARSSNQDIADKLYREYEALTKFACFFKEQEHFKVPKPVYYSLEDQLLVTEEMKGTSILNIGKQYASRRSDHYDTAIGVYNRAGRFLKVLHKSEAYPYSVQDLEEIENYIRERLFSGVFSKSEERNIFNYLKETQSEIKGNIQRYSKNPTHHDFAPGNILSDGENINVLDFGDYRIDHSYQDLAYFKLMLERQLESRIKYKPSAIRDLMSAFSKGYGCDYEIISKDKLYDLYVLKNYAIFITTFAHRKKWRPDFHLSFGFIKDRILNLVEFYRTKRKILKRIKRYVNLDGKN